jgi:hypothetical protein
MVVAQIRFFATRSDLGRILPLFEKAAPVQYVRFGWHDSVKPTSYKTYTELPDLGIAVNEQAAAGVAYLVCDAGSQLHPRRIEPSGQIKYAYDQLYNPDTIVFAPGGLWRPDILLYGEFGCVVSTEVPRRLMRRARAALKKTCKAIRACYVGPEAEQMLRAGGRLTIAERSPKEFDLAL